MRTQDGSGGSGGRMEKPIARAVTFFVSRIQIKHKKIHLALGHTWHSVILGTRSTWHSVILGTRSTWHSVTWHSVHLALGPLGTRSLGTQSQHLGRGGGAGKYSPHPYRIGLE